MCFITIAEAVVPPKDMKTLFIMLSSNIIKLNKNNNIAAVTISIKKYVLFIFAILVAFQLI